MTLQRPLFMQAAGGDTAFSYAAIATRQMYDMLYATEGVLTLGLQVTQRGAGANMSVDVAAGTCVIVGDDVTAQGKYLCVNDAGAFNVTVPAAPGSGTRIHRVVARIKDKLHSGSWTTYEWTLELLADTGSGTPATSASAINLARVTVTAGQVTVVNANITDDRVSALLAPTRPLQVSADAGRPPNPLAGEQIWRTDKSYFEVWTGTVWMPIVPNEPIRLKRKASDQTLTSSTTVVNDNDLVITDLTPNATYLIDGYFILIGNDTGNIKFGYALPSGATVHWTPDAINTSPGNDYGSIRRPDATGGSARSVGATAGANGGPLVATPRMWLVMGSSTGTFNPQFAQVTSNGTATGFGAGSTLIAQRVA